MTRWLHSARVAWSTAGALAGALGLSLLAPRLDAPQRPAATSTWVLPQEHARQLARQQGRPLLLVSLNGNLDGYC
jgi:hypothetical protein